MFLLKGKKEKTDVTINKSNYLMESSKVKENKPIQCLHYQKKKKVGGNFWIKMESTSSYFPGNYS